MIELLNGQTAISADGDIIHPDDDPSFAADTSPVDDRDDEFESLIRQERHDTAMARLEAIAKDAGPSVDLGMRAVALRDALEKGAKANGLGGWLQSSERIYDPTAVRKKHQILQQESRQAFQKAYGHDELVAAGYAEADAQRDADDAYVQFRYHYLRPKDDNVRKRRAALKKKLAQQAPKK